MRHRLQPLWPLLGALLALAAEPAFAAPGDGGQIVAGVLVLLAVVACGVGFVALCLVYLLLRPRRVRQGAEMLRRRPLRTFLTGIAGWLLLFVAAAVANLFPDPLKGLLILGLMLVATLQVIVGGAVVCQELGERLLGNWNSARLGSTAASLLAGGLLLVLTGLLPIAGQIFQTGVLVLALGAAINLLSYRRRPGEHTTTSTPAIKPDDPPAQP